MCNVATISRLPKFAGLCGKRVIQEYVSFEKETHKIREPANRCHSVKLPERTRELRRLNSVFLNFGIGVMNVVVWMAQAKWGLLWQQHNTYATHCKIQQHTLQYTGIHTARRCKTLQHTRFHTLQRTATHHRSCVGSNAH